MFFVYTFWRKPPKRQKKNMIPYFEVDTRFTWLKNMCCFQQWDWMNLHHLSPEIEKTKSFHSSFTMWSEFNVFKMKEAKIPWVSFKESMEDFFSPGDIPSMPFLPRLLIQRYHQTHHPGTSEEQAIKMFQPTRHPKAPWLTWNGYWLARLLISLEKWERWSTEDMESMC